MSTPSRAAQLPDESPEPTVPLKVKYPSVSQQRLSISEELDGRLSEAQAVIGEALSGAEHFERHLSQRLGSLEHRGHTPVSTDHYIRMLEQQLKSARRELAEHKLLVARQDSEIRHLTQMLWKETRTLESS